MKLPFPHNTRPALKVLAALFFLGSIALGLVTYLDMEPFPDTLKPEGVDVARMQVLDRNGVPLNVTYLNRWNVTDYVSLHDIPKLMRDAFVLAEDKRFYRHGGVDWLARSHALAQDIMARSAIRGASTITEQAVRILHPRPRTVWSRWVEGFEAGALERRFSKDDILEFYLNQIPYAAQRIGVAQAARYYFDRSLDTLDPREMLALAVLIRAPGRLDLFKGPRGIERPVRTLAGRMNEAGLMSPQAYEDILGGSFSLKKPSLAVQAAHFVRYVTAVSGQQGMRPAQGIIQSTLDASLQERIQNILDTRLSALSSRNVHHGAVLVIDNRSGEALAWVVSGGSPDPEVDASYINTVTTPRQPGSALKPFLYTMALEKGWTAATLIDDAPLATPVSTGLHEYHNYSRINYGPVRLREALGNSLNIPAVRTVKFVGTERFLDRLRSLGFRGLTAGAEHYGEGLALGNAEVTLFELVQAYLTLANQGVFRPISVLLDRPPSGPAGRVFNEQATSIISNILSDPSARLLEFGTGGLLNFPAQTAVKTGTSTDYRDAWSVGYSREHTVGVWMGNLDRAVMDKVSGSTGPALVLRSVFNELNRHRELDRLYLSPRLKSVPICSVTGKKAAPECPVTEEWFIPGTEPTGLCPEHAPAPRNNNTLLTAEHPGCSDSGAPIRIAQPTEGLEMAMDPRIPDELEAFAFTLSEGVTSRKVEWLVDGQVVGTANADNGKYLWPLSRGQHQAQARVWCSRDSKPLLTAPTAFIVK